jgi:hypothetical protein
MVTVQRRSLPRRNSGFMPESMSPSPAGTKYIDSILTIRTRRIILSHIQYNGLMKGDISDGYSKGFIFCSASAYDVVFRDQQVTNAG